ncbi:hypothetical protein AAG906_018827 [Vitis piasezkii]
MITWRNWLVVKIICPWSPLWSFGLWVKVMRITLLLQWRKINAQLCSVLWQSLILRFYFIFGPTKHALNFGIRRKGYTRMISNIASLKEEFLTVMPLTTDVGDQRTQIDKFFIVLMLIGLHPYLETVRDRFLFLKLALEEDAVLHGRPPRTAHMAQSSDLQSPQPPSSSTSPGISLGEYDDYLYYRPPSHFCCFCYPNCTGKTIGIGRESQGLYHLTAPSTLVVYISTNVPLLIHSRLGHPSLSKFQKMVPSFSSLSSLACESCQLGKHTRIPHSLLFSDQPLYVLPPRVFGCTCFVHVLTLGQDKLSARATKFSSYFKSYPSHYLPPMRCLLVHFRFIISSSCHCSSFFGRGTIDSLPIPSASLVRLASFCDLPITFRKVGCRWVYTVKVDPDGQVDRLKARLVAKGYTQLDIKNAFLHGDLVEEVYMEQPPGFVAQGESGLVCSTADHSVFYHHNSSGQCIYLVVYVDNIIITCSDKNDIQKLKQHLFTHFQTKDLGKLKYFLEIEIAQSSSGVVLSQRKYALDILEETGKPLGVARRYRRLVGKLNYLTITRPDISFPISVVSQFLQSPCDSHWDAIIRILRYIKSTPGQGSLAEYPAMALATCELIWLKHLLRELRFGKDEQMKLICDNQAALHIASNPVFHERTKHIEVDSLCSLLSLSRFSSLTALLVGFYVIEKKFFLQGSMSKTMHSTDGKRGENWAMTMEENSRAQIWQC